MAGMSKVALSRCRRMTLTEEGRGEEYRWLIEVFDPRLAEKRVVGYTARTAQDLSRVKRSFMGKYRVPEQNITVVELEATDGDA